MADTCDSFHKAVFEFKFQYRACHTKKAEIIAATEHLIGIPSLFHGKSATEIVVNLCRQLRLVHIQLDGVEQQVAIPTFGDSFLCIV